MRCLLSLIILFEAIYQIERLLLSDSALKRPRSLMVQLFVCLYFFLLNGCGFRSFNLGDLCIDL